MIDIVFNCDDNYSKYLDVVINSIKSNTREQCTFHIIGLDYHKNHICYPAPDINILHCKKQFSHISPSALYRLFIPKIINVNKIIYIDVDTVVLADIKELWDMPCKYISACKDPLSDYHSYKKLKINKNHYFNTGVLLMNLEAIRQDKNYLSNIIEASKNPYISLSDQDIFNIAFDLDLLPPEWNVFSKDYGQKYIENPKILHCCGKDKFWNSNIRGTKEWKLYNKG